MKPQGWLAPLTPLYGAAVAAKNAVYDHGLIRQKKLRGPVVSIGNLSTGGGGKTPFAISLAMLLAKSGMAVDVLSRGYGRSSGAVERVDASATSTSERFGDEPLLIAREAALPVYVGPQRYDAGLLAEREAVDLPRPAPSRRWLSASAAGTRFGHCSATPRRPSCPTAACRTSTRAAVVAAPR